MSSGRNDLSSQVAKIVEAERGLAKLLIAFAESVAKGSGATAAPKAKGKPGPKPKAKAAAEAPKSGSGKSSGSRGRPRSGKPSLPSRIRELFKESPGVEWTFETLRSKLGGAPEHGLRKALQLLVTDAASGVKRVRRGVFVAGGAAPAAAKAKGKPGPKPKAKPGPKPKAAKGKPGPKPKAKPGPKPKAKPGPKPAAEAAAAAPAPAAAKGKPGPKPKAAKGKPGPKPKAKPGPKPKAKPGPKPKAKAAAPKKAAAKKSGGGTSAVLATLEGSSAALNQADILAGVRDRLGADQTLSQVQGYLGYLTRVGKVAVHGEEGASRTYSLSGSN